MVVDSVGEAPSWRRSGTIWVFFVEPVIAGDVMGCDVLAWPGAASGCVTT
jgi:hypothetical protein